MSIFYSHFVVLWILNSSGFFLHTSGKWHHLTLTAVPLSYFSHLLCKLKCSPNSVRETRHLKPPVWKEQVLKVSYKVVNMAEVLQALHEQKKTVICLRKSFNGNQEVDTDITPLSGPEALQAAKSGALRQIVRPSLMSQITIGLGIGRATFQWNCNI